MKECKSDQANLSLLRKLNAYMKASVVNITTLGDALRLCWQDARLLRLLVGEGGVEQQENSQTLHSSLLLS